MNKRFLASILAILMLTAAAGAAHTVGDTRDFRARVGESGSDSEWQVVAGRLAAQGKQGNVWVLLCEDLHAKTAIPCDENCTLNGVDAINAGAIAVRFDMIYAAMTREFAPHANVHISTQYEHMPKIGDIDNDGRINILLYDIFGDGRPDSDGYVAGFFIHTDFHIPSDEIFRNALDLVHIDIGMNQGFSALKPDAAPAELLAFYYTLAHEFQHMLFYMYFGVYADSSEYLWFNEALSEVAGTFFTVPGLEIVDTAMLSHAAQNSYDNPNRGTYGDFLNFNGSYKNYAMSKLFGLFLCDRFGNDFTGKVYEAFIAEFPPAQNAEQKDAHRSRIAADGHYATMDRILRAATGADSLETLYFMFMEDLAENILFMYGECFESVPVLQSAGEIRLIGYGENTDSREATHEMLYRLSPSRESILHITPPECDPSTRYYVITADEVYELLPGETKQIDTKRQEAFLFAATFNRSVVTEDLVYFFSMNGDINGDGAVTITDALEILMYLAGLDSAVDYEATISDALEILMYLAGMDSRILV
jgi:hypothetical protein